MKQEENKYMSDLIELCKSEDEVKDLLEKERDNEEFQKLIKSPYRPLVAIKLYHKFGYGDCPCSNCNFD